MSLNSGERQVTTTVSEVRRDHVARYEFVANREPVGSSIIDFACGTGYGARVLIDAGFFVDGFDIDAETVEYARRTFGVYVTQMDGASPVFDRGYYAAVSFETIEHIEDPRKLLRALRECAPRLYASVPNQDAMPWRRPDGSTTAFHHRHYTGDEFEALLNECGWQVDEWHGQAGPESEVVSGIAKTDRTLIAVCSHCDPVEPAVPFEPHPARDYEEQNPVAGKHVAIIGLGPSSAEYLDIVKRQGGRHRFCDQVWTINAMGSVFACDLVFHMDDVRIQEVRAKARPESNIAAMLEWMRCSQVPIVSSRTHDDYPSIVEFPLEDVLNTLGHAYFNSTAAYAIAFAIYAGATEISVFGMDFSYENVHHAEKGRACVEFWLGKAHERGIKLNFPKNTTLMDSLHTDQQRLYGYDTRDVSMQVDGDGVLRVQYTERNTLPTAEEIERAYDHSRPPAEQHVIEGK